MIGEIKRIILADLQSIPKGYQSDSLIKELIRCVLYTYIKESGLIPVPNFRTPRYPEGPVDVAGLDQEYQIKWAISSNPTVELKDVKSMQRIDADRKLIISFSPHQRKVQESTFFLSKDVEHLYLYEKMGSD